FTRVAFLSNSSVGGFTRNGSLPEVSGGALYSRGGNLKVRDCTFFGNAVLGSGGNRSGGTGGEAAGGAIDSDDSGFLVGTIFAGNTARGGNSRNGLVGSSLSGAPAYGGALRAGASLAMTNCTFTSNAVYGGAAGGFGSPSGEARGGAISVIAGIPMLVNVTLASNSVNVPAPFGSPVPSFGMNIDAATNFSITLKNSLLAGTSNNVWGQIIDGGYNMSSDGSANFSSGTSFNFTNPKLLPLANNGGWTLTMALASDSPAIDWVPAALAPSTDQRGVHRPYGSASDVGAYEVGAPPPSLVILRNGGSVKILFAVETGSNYHIQHSLNLSTWETVQTTGTSTSNGVWTATFPVSQPAEYYRVTMDL
ncbi:MAG TPA: choice-of-anchor Q domain-containing protein, partial [Candidatus Binatia bacterium]|nr:choice-of-anchor Q domain-containing protein [Candidatus Binatia bacterium]